jgi:hypothetical protein
MQAKENSLVEYFRCPADLVPVATAGVPSSRSGYFRFGADAVCFGQPADVSPAERSDSISPDLYPAVTASGKGLVLPFHLANVIYNLRTEQYFKEADLQKKGFTNNAIVRSLYYRFFRRMMGVAVRKRLQRIHFTDWEKIPFPHWPVDFTVETILERVMALTLKHSSQKRIPFIWFWPDGAPSCAMMTHDVEATPGRDFCSSLMDMDDSSGIKSSFQIVPEARYEVSGSFLEGIRKRGFEINVHDLNHDGLLYSNREEFERRASKINQYAHRFGTRGFRSGAMYRNQDWFSSLDISYDMSVPNVAHLEAQRGGCCTVMPYFVGNILELPLTTIQDYTLFHMMGDYSIAILRQQAELILRRNGLITILTHPDYLIEAKARRVYMDLLAYVARLRSKENVWIALPAEVNKWWRARNQMTPVQRDGAWQIEGAGNERARLAFATIDSDRLVFELEGKRFERAIDAQVLEKELLLTEVHGI